MSFPRSSRLGNDTRGSAYQSSHSQHRETKPIRSIPLNVYTSKDSSMPRYDGSARHIPDKYYNNVNRPISSLTNDRPSSYQADLSYELKDKLDSVLVSLSQFMRQNEKVDKLISKFDSMEDRMTQLEDILCKNMAQNNQQKPMVFDKIVSRLDVRLEHVINHLESLKSGYRMVETATNHNQRSIETLLERQETFMSEMKRLLAAPNTTKIPFDDVRSKTTSNTSYNGDVNPTITNRPMSTSTNQRDPTNSSVNKLNGQREHVINDHETLKSSHRMVDAATTPNQRKTDSFISDRTHISAATNTTNIPLDDVRSKMTSNTSYNGDGNPTITNRPMSTSTNQRDRLLDHKNDRNSDITMHKSLLPSKIKVQEPHSSEKRRTQKSLTPRGLDNPAGFCYLNCVIQLLRGCKEFNEQVGQYYSSHEINNSKASDNEKRFVNDFCQLFDDLNKRNDTSKSIQKVQSHFNETSVGDDVMQSFMKVLSKIHDVVAKRSNFERTGSLSGMSADEAYEGYKVRHNGFVFDSFYGQMSNKLLCARCKHCLRESFQLFKTISLPVTKTHKQVGLEFCFKDFFELSVVEEDESLHKIRNSICRCNQNDRQRILSQIEITHAPKYLFVYLNRGSYISNDFKNDTYVHCQEMICLQTQKSPICYQLISVVDHLGTNDGGHYFVKSCLENYDWYKINDKSVSQLNNTKDEVVTRDTIVFLFKRLD